MSSPLISILVPVYNCEQYLDQCITSIINQDYSNLQIVLANDGSTDKSLEICRSYAENDTRITVLTRENKGVASTRNDLLEQIEGEYFLFVDADDWIETDMVSYLYGSIKEYDADISVCANVTFNNKDQQERRSKRIYNIQVWNQKETIEKFLYHKAINGSLCNKLIKTYLIGNNRFENDIYYGEDALFIWNLLQDFGRLIISNKELYHYRMNSCSLSHKSFGWKKLTANKVWETISYEAEIAYPDLAPIGKARWGMEMMQLLLLASKNNKPLNEDIRNLQKIVRENMTFMKKFNITSKKGIIYAWMVSHYYGFNKLISKFI